MATKTLHFSDPRHLSQLYAGHDENLRHAERVLGLKLVTRDDWLTAEGPTPAVASGRWWAGR